MILFKANSLWCLKGDSDSPGGGSSSNKNKDKDNSSWGGFSAPTSKDLRNATGLRNDGGRGTPDGWDASFSKYSASPVVSNPDKIIQTQRSSVAPTYDAAAGSVYKGLSADTFGNDINEENKYDAVNIISDPEAAKGLLKDSTDSSGEYVNALSQSKLYTYDELKKSADESDLGVFDRIKMVHNSIDDTLGVSGNTALVGLSVMMPNLPMTALKTAVTVGVALSGFIPGGNDPGYKGEAVADVNANSTAHGSEVGSGMTESQVRASLKAAADSGQLPQSDANAINNALVNNVGDVSTPGLLSAGSSQSGLLSNSEGIKTNVNDELMKKYGLNREV